MKVGDVVRTNFHKKQDSSYPPTEGIVLAITDDNKYVVDSFKTKTGRKVYWYERHELELLKASEYNLKEKTMIEFNDKSRGEVIAKTKEGKYVVRKFSDGTLDMLTSENIKPVAQYAMQVGKRYSKHIYPKPGMTATTNEGTVYTFVYNYSTSLCVAVNYNTHRLGGFCQTAVVTDEELCKMLNTNYVKIEGE